MTALNKIVRRRTLRPFDHHGRRLVIELEPSGAIAIREERCRQAVKISIPALYTWLLRYAAEQAAANRRVTKTQARREMLEGYHK